MRARFTLRATQSGNHPNGTLTYHDVGADIAFQKAKVRRRKIVGHARVEEAAEHPELFAQLAEPEIARAVERFFFIDVLSFDWNCQQYITLRYTLVEVWRT